MLAAKAALAKKAQETVILELKGLTIIADYFVICSGESTTQVRAITDQIEAEFRKKSIKPLSVEGIRSARWALIDFGDVVVHVFEDETRNYYELEKLWLDAPRVSIEGEGGK
ncbi:MAG TPA: ribosome silencing factor [Thermodesulfovibrionales bacterium]|jgi:ribosome-associated protein|nr:ribosome silencing factor [Thermodesulfovibrionales bacterium]